LQKKLLLDQFAELAAKEGLSLNDVIGEDVEPKKKTTVPVKYRSPADTSLAWTGRGRQPKWIQEHIANGGKLENLII
jgi:DNA-binding protein H-NS